MVRCIAKYTFKREFCSGLFFKINFFVSVNKSEPQDNNLIL